MDMSLSHRDWPQLRDESRHDGDSVGPEWRSLLARLDVAQTERNAVRGEGEMVTRGSFSPGSAHSLEGLGGVSNDSAAANRNRGVNLGNSGNCKLDQATGMEEAGNAINRPRED